MNEEIESLKKLKAAADSISQAVGNAKLPVIAKVFEDEDVAEALTMLLDPMVTIGIGEKSLDKALDKQSDTYYASLVFMCKQLSKKKGITDQDIKDVQCYLERIRERDEELARFAREFITKTLTIGATAKTVNKALGKEAIPEFKCMLANKYFEHQKAVEGKEFTLTLKMDGIRCMCIIENGTAKFYTRQGQEIEGLNELAEEMLRFNTSVVFDGELLIDGGLEMESKTAYKLTTQIVRKDGEKVGVTYHIFDLMTVEDFKSRTSSMTYSDRRMWLDIIEFSVCGNRLKHVRIVPALYQGKDTDKIIKVLDKVRLLHQEGVMINLNDAPYQFKRTNDLLKVKVMNDCDLEITGVQEGTGRFKGTLGSLIVSYKGNSVGVGSGLSEDMRKAIWSNPNGYIGRVATIQYFEETKDKTGKLSIRFPVFKELREKGKEVSYN